MLAEMIALNKHSVAAHNLSSLLLCCSSAASQLVPWRFSGEEKRLLGGHFLS